jgi:hypothetical protein
MRSRKFEHPKEKLSFAYWKDYLGRREDRPLCHNTRVERISACQIGIRLYSTYIVRYHANGDVDLANDRAWWTQATMDRLNYYSPFLVYRDHCSWLVYAGPLEKRWSGNANRRTFRFTGFMRVYRDRRRRPWNGFISRISTGPLGVGCERLNLVPSWQVVLTQRKKEIEKRRAQRAKRQAQRRKARRYGRWLQEHDLVEVALYDWIRRYENDVIEATMEEVHETYHAAGLYLDLGPPSPPTHFERVIHLV